MQAADTIAQDRAQTGRSAVDATFTLLQARVLHGRWCAGDKVPTEASLVRELGVSRTTVREALNRLASTGLIIAPHSGTRRVADFRDCAGLEVLSALVVSPEGQVDLQVVRSVTEMRGAIAPDVARLAARRRTEAQAAELTRIAAELDPAASLQQLLDATLAWWTVLVLASDNLAYRLAYNTLRTTYTEGSGLLQQVIAEELRAVGLYRAIAASVSAGDAATAASLCNELVDLGGSAIDAAIQAFSSTP